MNVTTKLVLDTRRVKSNNKYPVKIRVFFLRRFRDYKTSYDLSKEEFINASSARPNKYMRDIIIELNALLSKANGIIKGLSIFSYEHFEKRFYVIQNDAQNIFAIFKSYIEELEKVKRIGTASSYRCAMISIKTFAGKIIGFYDVTEKFLSRYHQWMLDKGNSLTTIGIYIRSLRSIFNIAIEEGIIKREDAYPFGRRKYQIPAGSNTKKALTIEDIKKIVEYLPSAEKGFYEERSRDFWLFSYLSNGMNFNDLANLRWANIDGEIFRFTRVKTQKTEISNSKLISVYMNDLSFTILKKWGSVRNGMNDFVFDILDKSDDEYAVKKKVYQLVQTTNKNMKKIFENLSIKKPHTTYVARHSFSTILKKSGASIEQIQESLGHSSSTTTMKYLDSFDDDTKKELSKALINF